MYLKQQFKIYDGKYTNSGLYIFSPVHESTKVEDIEIKKMVINVGQIKKCIQVFYEVTKMKSM